MQTYTPPQEIKSADRQRTVHTHKQAQKEKFVWIGVQGFLNAEEYRIVVCWDAPAVSSCAHIETQMTAHFPGASGMQKTPSTLRPPILHQNKMFPSELRLPLFASALSSSRHCKLAPL